MSEFPDIEGPFKFGVAAAGIIIIPKVDPFLDNIDIGRIAGGKRNESEMDSDLKMGILGQRRLGDDSSPETHGADFENLAVPKIIMLKSPDQHFQLSRVNGLAEQKTVSDHVVQIFFSDIFPVAQIEPSLEEIKGLSSPDLERISVIDEY